MGFEIPSNSKQSGGEALGGTRARVGAVSRVESCPPAPFISVNSLYFLHNEVQSSAKGCLQCTAWEVLQQLCSQGALWPEKAKPDLFCLFDTAAPSHLGCSVSLSREVGNSLNELGGLSQMDHGNL